MSTVKEILMQPPGIVLRAIAMLLTLVQMHLLLRVLLQKRGFWVTLLYGLHTLCGLLLMTLLFDGAYRLDYLLENAGYERTYPAAVEWVTALPWAAVAFLLCLSAGLCVLCVLRVSAYARTHPSTKSIKQTVDLLPTGICFADQSGLTLLSNLKMNACNSSLTGSSYSDAETLWKAAQAQGETQGEKLLVRLSDETVLLMERSELELDGRRLVQITAEDVSEQYRITAELAEKNARLKAVQLRLKAYREQQAKLAIRQELLAARTSVHNQLGSILLTGRYHLEHPESADPKTLRLLLQHINTYLLSEAEEPELDEDCYESALQAAEGFGVTVEQAGTLPPPGTLRALLAQAIVECAANTVKHAGGNRLEVSGRAHGFTITNNGTPPKEEIRPTGGLRSLCLAVQQAGGTAELQSEPVFSLTVHLP